MSELQTLSDIDLAVLFQKTMNRHDSLVDSVPMGDERIYFAGKKCDAIKEEQRRRGYTPCQICFDGGTPDADPGAYCACAMGERLMQDNEQMRRKFRQLERAEPREEPGQ